MKAKLTELAIPYTVADMAATSLMSNGKNRVVFFLELVAKGESPKMAEVLATQSPPGIGITDDIYIADQNRHGRTILDQFNGNEAQLKIFAKELKKKGYTLKSTDKYIPTAATEFADPKAILNHGQNSLKKLSEKKETPPTRVKACGGKRLNEKIVRRIMQEKFAKDPGLRFKDTRELRESIIDKHGTKALR
jgi:hypothetical protein